MESLPIQDIYCLFRESDPIFTLVRINVLKKLLVKLIWNEAVLNLFIKSPLDLCLIKNHFILRYSPISENTSIQGIKY